MENLRNRIDVKLVHNEKDYSKCTSKPSYMSHKIFDHNLVAIGKYKLALKVVSATFLLVCFLHLNESTCQTSFLFHFKSSFRSQGNEILEFYTLKFHDVIQYLSIKQEIRFPK